MRWRCMRCVVSSGPLATVRSMLLLLMVSITASTAHADDLDRSLGAGDLLKVSVFGYPDLTTDVRVSQSGRIAYPLVGEVAVAGQSPSGVAALLKQRLISGGFIRDPQISVLVLEYESQKVSVLGQVNRPGKYALASSSHLLDFLAEAGDVINDAAADTATIMRKDGSRQTVNLVELFAGDPEQNIVVRGGDTIYVPKAPKFYIYGEVRTPGVYRLERGMTLSRAISVGGGLTPRGSESRVVVKRKDAESGVEKEVSVGPDSELYPEDVLMVKERWF